LHPDNVRAVIVTSNETRLRLETVLSRTYDKITDKLKFRNPKTTQHVICGVSSKNYRVMIVIDGGNVVRIFVP